MKQIITTRRILIVAIHLFLFVTAYLLAFILRFDFTLPRAYLPIALKWMPWAVLCQFVVFGYFRMYSGSWRYVGVRDLVGIVRASVVAGVVSAIGWYFVYAPYAFPRSVFILHAAATIGLVAAARAAHRVTRELWRVGTKDSKRVLIVGAGDAGEMLVREMRLHREAGYLPIGFVDDDALKRGSRIHDVPVLGGVEMLPKLVTRHAIEEILIATPTATNERMRRIVDYCKETGATFKTLPGMTELIDGRVSITRFREVKIEDLLGRGPVQLDAEAIGAFLRGNVVLVTGAGGSIGSELVRQAVRHAPSRVVAVDRAEHGLFHLLRNIQEPEVNPHGVPVIGLVGDVTDSARVAAILKKYAPAVVFHAAAHKHVPLMEDNLGEAVKNNVVGTATVADACVKAGVSTFVLISTDKAVRPSSVMGATKRAAERYVRLLSQKTATRFLAVRFGNVLGSAGSVVPLFTEQIARGGPVTVTHPDMERYFMTIPEAVQLVLQAATMGSSGEVLILEMGKPVKIVDLARDLITLSGFEPDVDIKIEFSGTRPGEKLREELVTTAERVTRTRHPKILIANETEVVPSSVARSVDELRDLTAGEDVHAIRRTLCEMVPEYSTTTTTTTPTETLAADVETPGYAKVLPLHR